MRSVIRIIGSIFAITVASTATGFGQSRSANESVDYFRGDVEFRHDTLWINKDRGRVREDHWRTDGPSGGIERLYIETGSVDPNGYRATLEGRVIHDNSYDFSLLINKKDRHYLRLDFSGLRRYYDGSNEPWDAPMGDLAETADGDIYVDRQTYNIEFGLTPPDNAEIIFGWNRLVKDGKEVLLRGADGVTAGDDTYSSVPITANVKGVTDTLYTEVAYTMDEKFNVRARQEFEQYHDDQRTDISSFKKDGTIKNSDVVNDDLGYTNWRTLLMFDSFLDDEHYVTANYMYNYLHSNSHRNNVGYHEHTTDTGGSSRKTNVGAFGYRVDNVAGVEKLSLIAGARIEDSRTRSHMSGSSKYYNFMAHQYVGPKSRIVESRLDEVPINETLRVTYQGIKRTTLSFDADLEQRVLHFSERDRHGGVFSDPDLSRQADIDMTDQIYSFKAVRRLNRALKSTLKVRLKDLERSTTDHVDESAFYPGYLDSTRTTGEEVSFATDYFMANNATARVMYQFIHESIDTSLAGKAQNLEIHRGAGSLSFSPIRKLFVVGMFMLDNYRLDTPAIGTAGNHAQGASPFDFKGTSYSFLLDGTYTFTQKTSCTFGIQHTEAIGSTDFAGNYAFDSIGTMLNYKRSKNQTIGLGYRFLNFNSHTGAFDDYTGHGLTVRYSYSF